MKNVFIILILSAVYCFSADIDEIKPGTHWEGTKYKAAIKGKVTLLVIWGG